MTASGLSLDTGALIAVERGNRRVLALLDEAERHGLPIHVVAGVVAQAWRGGPRQARLARFLAVDGLEIPVLDSATARAVGELCGHTGHDDVVDVHVVLDARATGHLVVTSDPDDLRRVDPGLPLVSV